MERHTAPDDLEEEIETARKARDNVAAAYERRRSEDNYQKLREAERQLLALMDERNELSSYRNATTKTR